MKAFATEGTEELVSAFRIGALYAGDSLGVYAWNNIANQHIVFKTFIARSNLKPRYGQGFDVSTQRSYENHSNSTQWGGDDELHG